MNASRFILRARGPKRWLPLLAAGILLFSAGAPLARAGESPEAEYARKVREGVEHFNAGRFGQAAALFRDALKIREEPGTWFNLGAAAFRLDRMEEAEDAFRRAVKARRGNYPEARRYLGRIFFAREEWRRAVEELGKGLTAGGDGLDWKLLASAYERLGDEANARRALERAVLAEPSDAGLRAALARNLFRSGRHDAARVEFRAALDLVPGDPRLYRDLGYTLIALDRGDEAIDALEAARRLGDGGDRSVLLALADLYASRNMDREAASIYQKALDGVQAGAEDWFRLGTLRVRAGDEGPAREAFEKALQVAPDHLRTLLALGNLALDAGRVDPARAWYRKALAVDPNAADALAGLGDADYREGRWRESADAYRKALAVRPGSGRFWKRLGHAEFAAERYGPASRAYRRALEFDPGDREAQAYLSASESLLRRTQ